MHLHACIYAHTDRCTCKHLKCTYACTQKVCTHIRTYYYTVLTIYCLYISSMHGSQMSNSIARMMLSPNQHTNVDNHDIGLHVINPALVDRQS